MSWGLLDDRLAFLVLIMFFALISGIVLLAYLAPNETMFVAYTLLLSFVLLATILFWWVRS
mgnify:CR=1 FL=1